MTGDVSFFMQRTLPVGGVQPSVSTAIAVWIAVATMHKEAGNYAVFSKRAIAERVEWHGLCKVSQDTVSTHISAHCVANAPANCAVPHRKIYRVGRDRYRLYRRGDPCDAFRKNCEAAPPASSLPEAYGDLRRWHDEEYNRPSPGRD